MIVMDDIGKDCPLASLANNNNRAGQEIASPIGAQCSANLSPSKTLNASPALHMDHSS